MSHSLLLLAGLLLVGGTDAETGVEPGARVRITAPSVAGKYARQGERRWATRFVGDIHRIADDAIEIYVKGHKDPAVVPFSAIDRLEVAHGKKSNWRWGVLTGAVVGLGLTFAYCSSPRLGGSCDSQEQLGVAHSLVASARQVAAWLACSQGRIDGRPYRRRIFTMEVPVRRIGLLLSVLTLACGGGGGGSVVAPPVPSRTVIVQGTVQLADPLTALGQGRMCDFLAFVPFTTSAQGSLDVTVEWTFATNDIDVFLERGECNCAVALQDRCEDAASAESTTAKPERLTVPNLSAGSYTLAIANAGPGRESASYQIGLTR